MTTPARSDHDAAAPTSALRLVDTDPAELSVDAVVIGVYSQDATAPNPLLLAAGSESVAVAFDGKLTDTLGLLGASGSAGEVTKVATLGTVTAPLVVAVGLGPEPTGAMPTTETLRRARRGRGPRAGRIRERRARAAGGRGLDEFGRRADHDALRGICEGALLGAYRFAGYKSTPVPPRRTPVGDIAVHVADAAEPGVVAEVDRALVVAAAVARTRDWVNTPANNLRPPAFAEQAAAAARAVGLDVEVLDEKQLRDGGYGGITAVGQGSEAPPRLVRMVYTPTDAGANTRSASR